MHMPHVTNAYMKDDITRVLRKLKELVPDDLQQAHDEMIEGFDDNGMPMSQGEASFELDEKTYRVPFQKLREALQNKDTGGSQQAQEVFAGRIPRSVGSSFKSAPRANPEPDLDPTYYWDKNYNYEYMNPESEKKRVLGKIKK